MYYALSVLSLLAALWSVHLARADAAFRQATPEGVTRAVELLPHNTSYLALAALQAEYDGRDATPLLGRIAQLNPTISAPRIRLGLAAEQRADLPAAERWLREAYAVDRQYETRWTLANFYLRQNRADEFWTWIQSALDVSYGDRTPAFDLCWRMSSDPNEILTRAIPDSVAADYLAYLIPRHLDAVVAASKRVNNQALLLNATDALLTNARYTDAVEVWRQAGRPTPDGITAPNFEAPQTGQGFDWRLNKSMGVRHPFPGRIALSGEQPESVQLLSQFVGGLHPGTRYQLTWKSSEAVPGVHWRINGEPTTEFRATAEVAVLSLWYQRPLGEVRAEATFDLSNVTLSALH